MILGIPHEWVSSKNTTIPRSLLLGDFQAAGIKLSFVRGDELYALAGDKNTGTPD